MRGKLNKLKAIATVTCGIISSSPKITHQHIRIGTQLLPPHTLYATVFFSIQLDSQKEKRNLGVRGTRVVGNINR